MSYSLPKPTRHRSTVLVSHHLSRYAEFPQQIYQSSILDIRALSHPLFEVQFGSLSRTDLDHSWDRLEFSFFLEVGSDARTKGCGPEYEGNIFTCMYLMATFGTSLVADCVSESFGNALLVCS